MLLTKEYQEQVKKMHNGEAKKIGFGVEPPPKLIEFLSASRCFTVLDFGCGQGTMLTEVSKKFPEKQLIGYDPGVERYNNFPDKVDFIYSVDVIEHIEPEFIDTVLEKLFLTADFQYHNIACHPAKKKLPDGRNCHLIIEQPDWWLKKITAIIKGRAEIIYTNTYTTKIKGNRINTYFEIAFKK
jgi:trans-aconitate methyltransferase